MTYWKFGGGYSYRNKDGKMSWKQLLKDVPAYAKGIKTPKKPAAPKKKRQASSPSKRRKKTVPKKTKKKGGNGKRILGSYSIKGLLLGSGVLAASKLVVPQAGAYGTGGALAVAGAAAKFLDLPGKALLPVGVMVFASEYILGMLGGGVGAGNGGTGGTDY